MDPASSRTPFRRITALASLALLSALVGAVAGLGAAAFHRLVGALTVVMTGVPEYGAGDRTHALFPQLGPWFVLAVPVLAGLVYGPLLQWLAPGPQGQGIAEVNHAVDTNAGRLLPRRTGAKVAASAVCIAGGGSVGRVGPIVELTAAMASSAGQALRASPDRLRSLVAGGAAGGFAAILGAPLAAPFFAIELITGRFRVTWFLSAAVSGVTADAVAAEIADRPPHFDLTLDALPGAGLYLVLPLFGALVGAVGVLFSRTLFHVQQVCDRTWHWPQWLRPVFGGLLLGGLLLWLPQLYGVGDPAVHDALGGAYVAGFLVVLLLGKLAATSLTFGIGGYGGLFGPMLFVGTMAGAALGAYASRAGITDAPVWLFGLLGIGAVLATAARAPFTAVLLPAELAGMPELLLALAVVVLSAAVTGRALHGRSIFAIDLLRRSGSA